MIAGLATAGRPSTTRLSVVVTPAAVLQVERRTNLTLDPADRARFEAILESRPSVGTFVSTAWLSGFFAQPADGAELSLLLFREGQTLCGFLPIAVRTMLGLTRVTLLGGGLGSDRIDLMAARGAEPACADSFLTWLDESFGRTGFVLELRDVPADSPLWGAVHRAGRSGGPLMALSLREVQALPYLDLGDDCARHAPTAASPSRTDSLDRHRRLLTRRGDVRIDLLSDPNDAVAAFDTLVGFLRDRWADHGGSALADPGRQRFHRCVIPRLLDEGRLRMIRLSVTGRAVGIFYGFALGNWWGYYLAGYDREWAGRIHLGRILIATAIDCADRHGAVEFDFLKGAEPVKYLWPVRERTTIDAEIMSDRLAPQLVRAAHAARETAAALMKSARGWRLRP